MSDSKICTSCGKEKPLDEFRKYPNGTSVYRYCLACQSIETRRKYLLRLVALDEANQQAVDDLAKIEQLYDALERDGLVPPGRKVQKKGTASAASTMQIVQDLLDEHQ